MSRKDGEAAELPPRAWQRLLDTLCDIADVALGGCGNDGILGRLVDQTLQQEVFRGVRLAYLAPDITEAIATGSQPPTLSARALARASRLPLDWNEQRRLLGFAEARSR